MGKYFLGIFVTLFFCSRTSAGLHKGDVISQTTAHARSHAAYSAVLLTIQEKAPGQSAATPSPRQKFSLERILLGLACMLTAGALFVFVWKRWQVLDEPPPPGASPPEKETNP